MVESFDKVRGDDLFTLNIICTKFTPKERSVNILKEGLAAYTCVCTHTHTYTYFMRREPNHLHMFKASLYVQLNLCYCFQESKDNVVARQDLNELDLSLGLKSHDDDDSDSRTEDAKDGEELDRVNSGT